MHEDPVRLGLLQPLRPGPRDDVDPVLGVARLDPAGQDLGVGRRARDRVGRQVRHRRPRHREPGRDLRADVAAADDDHAPRVRVARLCARLVGELARAVVVAERPEVDDARARRQVQLARPPTGREQQGAIAVLVVVVRGHDVTLAVDARHAGRRAHVGAGGVGRAEVHRVGGAVLVAPQVLRQRRTLVRLVDVLRQDRDAAVRVELPDPAGGRVGGHPATDDHVVVVEPHHRPPGAWEHRRTVPP